MAMHIQAKTSHVRILQGLFSMKHDYKEDGLGLEDILEILVTLGKGPNLWWQADDEVWIICNSNKSLPHPLLPVLPQNVPFVLPQSTFILRLPRGLLVPIWCFPNSDHAHKYCVQKETEAGDD